MGGACVGTAERGGAGGAEGGRSEDGRGGGASGAPSAAYGRGRATFGWMRRSGWRGAYGGPYWGRGGRHVAGERRGGMRTAASAYTHSDAAAHDASARSRATIARQRVEPAGRDQGG